MFSKTDSQTFDVPYDGKSIMHYSSTIGGSKKCPTITSNMEAIPTEELGGSKLSDSDILKIRRMYGCSKCLRS